VRPFRAVAAVWFAAAAAPLLAQQDEAPAPIADNSFLIEEAFNQERGVVQHISAFTRADGGGAWAYSFTQEWPLRGMRNQLSYTVPVHHDEGSGTGVGDIGLNYRYQLIGMDGGPLFVAPRATLLLPTGDERRGRGAGGVGFQANLPVSILPTRQLALHANAGATWTPSAKSPLGAESGTLDANAGGSVIWLVRPSFNLLVELLWYSTESVVAPVAEARQDTWLVNPGVRWAFNFPSGLQIVPGIAYTIGLGDGDKEDGLFLYLSFEHPFTHTSP
jgi:outer membrane putative beta-barrel porin/alpha-amylase